MTTANCSARPGTEPTRRELDRDLIAWRAYLETGSMKRAADKLGVHEITIRKRIAALRQTYDVTTNAQLADVLARGAVA